jgi:hypothetical protein
MLELSKFLGNLPKRTLMEHATPRFQLVSPDRLRMIMERTGTGASISGRELAAAAGISHGAINNLLMGHIRTASSEAAHQICATVGVDLLVLWAPVGRAVPDAEPSGDLIEAAA